MLFCSEICLFAADDCFSQLVCLLVGWLADGLVCCAHGLSVALSLCRLLARASPLPHVCQRLCVRLCVHACVCVHVRLFVLCLFVFDCCSVCLSVCMFVLFSACVLGLCMCVFVCACVCVRVCVRVCVCLYVRVSLCWVGGLDAWNHPPVSFQGIANQTKLSAHPHGP